MYTTFLPSFFPDVPLQFTPDSTNLRCRPPFFRAQFDIYLHPAASLSGVQMSRAFHARAISPRRPIMLASTSRTSQSSQDSQADLLTQLSQFGAGALAGLVNTLILSPLDVVKTRLQVQGSSAYSAARYRGLFDALASMLRQEGFASYYRGVSASLWAFVPNWAIYWYTYETFKRMFGRDARRPTPFVHVLSAVSAGGITAVSTAPFWTLKSRLQVDMATNAAARRYRSVPHGFRKIIAEEGIWGLYKGLTPTLLGLGHVAIQFPLYEHLKTSLSGGRYEDLRAGHVLMASSLSKMVASAVFYPHEVLRARIQVDRSVIRKGFEPMRMVRLAKEILRKDGLAGFYRGFGTNLMRTVPACMLTFTSYELAKRFAQNYTNRNKEVLDREFDEEMQDKISSAKTARR